MGCLIVALALIIGPALIWAGFQLNGLVDQYELTHMTMESDVWGSPVVALWAGIGLAIVAVILIVTYLSRVYPAGRMSRPDEYDAEEISDVAENLFRQFPPDVVAARRVMRQWNGAGSDTESGAYARFVNDMNIVAMSSSLPEVDDDIAADDLDFITNDLQLEMMRSVLYRSFHDLPLKAQGGNSESFDDYRRRIFTSLDALRLRRATLIRVRRSVLRWRGGVLVISPVLIWLCVQGILTNIASSAVGGILLNAAVVAGVLAWIYNTVSPTMLAERRWSLGFADQWVEFWMQSAYRILSPYFLIRRLRWNKEFKELTAP